MTLRLCAPLPRVIVRDFMGKCFDAITPELRAWIAEQKIFFVATAPRDEQAHLSCSPKGGDSFRVLGDHEVAYLDLTGSGIETVAHLQENGRIVIMFCAFSGTPRILRLHGKGEVLYPDNPEFKTLEPAFPPLIGARAIIRVRLTRISDSCGYAVPLMDFVAPRDVLDKWCEKKGPEGLAEYRRQKNARSIDGIPGYAS